MLLVTMRILEHNNHELGSSVVSQEAERIQTQREIDKWVSIYCWPSFLRLVLQE